MTDLPLESSHGFASDLSAEVIPATSPDLLTWLLAQINEDERVAQAARHGVSGRWVQPRDGEGDGRGAVEYGSGGNDWPEWSGNGVVVYDEGAPTPEQAEHIARHDPARVLREVEAKRRILDRYEACRDQAEGEERALWASVAQAEYEDWTLPALALSYADRPGYRQEWRP